MTSGRISQPAASYLGRESLDRPFRLCRGRDTIVAFPGTEQPAPVEPSGEPDRFLDPGRNATSPR